MENRGRVNYGLALNEQRKGGFGSVLPNSPRDFSECKCCRTVRVLCTESAKGPAQLSWCWSGLGVGGKWCEGGNVFKDILTPCLE